MTSILWRRLDAPGCDACRLVRTGEGWRLEGGAVFRDEGGAPSAVRYELECDAGWRSRRGRVHGWAGGRAVDHRIERDPDGPWSLDGSAVPGLAHCLDLDLGFTPATNLTQLRRIALEIGESAEAPVVWFDLDTGRLEEVIQRYERISTGEYRYEAARFGYSATLDVDGEGFVVRYPNLWEATP